VLHIGYPKTGTSSLQWFLHTHRDSLLRQGVCYPMTGQVDDHAHHKLAFALADNEYERPDPATRTELFSRLTEEIETSGAPLVILSSELFLYRLELIQQSEEFRRLLAGRPLRIICFLRKQTAFLESLYRHFIWDAAMRFTGGPGQFLDKYPFAGDYCQTLTAWSGVAGAEVIVPVVYEQAMRGEGCIRRFCRLAGVRTEGLPAEDFDVRRNVTVAPTLLTELMRTANGDAHLDRDQLITLAEKAKTFAGGLGELPLPTRLFTPGLIDRIESMYAASNRRLADEFVRQPLDGAWFREDA
jgi:hypothetical protein